MFYFSDEDKYVKNRKVSKKKVKLDDEDRDIYRKFSYEKSCKYLMCPVSIICMYYESGYSLIIIT